MGIEVRGRRVLVTGGAGFLGRRVVECLRAEAAGEIIVPRSAEYDLTRQEDAERLYRDARPEVVIHLAARVGGIGANRRNPAKFFYENMAMGLHVVEGARRTGAAKVVLVGTTCSYPKHTPTPFREDDLWNGYPEETNAPYGVAKRALIVMGQAYRQQYGLNVIALIPANLYGPGDSFDLEDGHVIPALIRKCVDAVERGEDRVVLWGDGSPTREFLYVGDAAEGVVMATRAYDGETPVNLGSSEEISIRDLAEMIARMTGFQGRIVWDTSRPNGQPLRRLDVSRALQCFGFRARTSLREGLQRTVDWYRAQVSTSSRTPARSSACPGDRIS